MAMTIAPREDKSSAALAFVGIVLALGALHVARDIFVPVAIAILMSFLLAPMVKRLTRWHLPNAAAVIITVFFAFCVLALVGWIISMQFLNFVENLPLYQDNLRSKIATFLAPGDGTFSRASEVLDSLRDEIERSTASPTGEEDATDPVPIPVNIEEEGLSPLETLRQIAGPLLGPLGTAGLAVIFVIFILLQRNDLRDRFIKLVSGGNLNMAVEAVDDATRRISRYLLMHTVINVAYGVPIAVGLFLIGVPNSLLWGILATLLRFIPYLGAWIAALFPVSVAFAVDPGWTMPLLTIALILCLELVSNNVLEPWLYGSSTGISAVALIFAALVWTWIWGPVGLFLSTPLTVCLLVIGKNSTSLQFLDVVLGSDPVLAPEAQMYERMLAMDSEDMVEIAERDLAEDASLSDFYDRTMIPALSLAERDRHSGALAERRQEFIAQSTRDLLDDLGERYVTQEFCLIRRGKVLCIPARDQADELGAMMLAQLLKQAGINSEITQPGASRAEIVRQLQESGATVACICAIPPAAMIAARRLCRLLSSLEAPLHLIAGIWGERASGAELQRRLGSPAPDVICTTFASAVKQISDTMQIEDAPMVPAPVPEGEEARIADLRRLGLDDATNDDIYDAVTARLVNVFELPIALVSIIDRERQYWRSQKGLPDAIADIGHTARAESICGHLVALNEFLAIEDLSQDERFSNNPLVNELGIRFYAGAPLRTRAGHVVGTLCVMDTRPRKITEDQKWLLTALADELMQYAEAANTLKTGELTPAPTA